MKSIVAIVAILATLMPGVVFAQERGSTGWVLIPNASLGFPGGRLRSSVGIPARCTPTPGVTGGYTYRRNMTPRRRLP